MCRSSAAVKLLASESDGRGFESRRQLFFLFFFFNIHTSDKLEIYFDHSILVNGVDPWGVHRFLGGINHENGIYSMGQRHECGSGYIIITIYEVVYKIERASECFLAPRYTRFIAFTSKNMKEKMAKAGIVFADLKDVFSRYGSRVFWRCLPCHRNEF